MLLQLRAASCWCYNIFKQLSSFPGIKSSQQHLISDILMTDKGTQLSGLSLIIINVKTILHLEPKPHFMSARCWRISHSDCEELLSVSRVHKLASQGKAGLFIKRPTLLRRQIIPWFNFLRTHRIKGFK